MKVDRRLKQKFGCEEDDDSLNALAPEKFRD
jgi:hypothetical protein